MTVVGGDGDGELEIEVSDDPTECKHLVSADHLPVTVTLTKVRMSVCQSTFFSVLLFARVRVRVVCNDENHV